MEIIATYGISNTMGIAIYHVDYDHVVWAFNNDLENIQHSDVRSEFNDNDELDLVFYADEIEVFLSECIRV